MRLLHCFRFQVTLAVTTDKLTLRNFVDSADVAGNAVHSHVSFERREFDAFEVSREVSEHRGEHYVEDMEIRKWSELVFAQSERSKQYAKSAWKCYKKWLLTPQAMDITFSLKTFKTILNFSEGQQLDVNIRYDRYVTISNVHLSGLRIRVQQTSHVSAEVITAESCRNVHHISDAISTDHRSKPTDLELM